MTRRSQRHPGESLVPLADRFTGSTALRVAILIAPVVVWLADRAHRSAPLADLLVPGALYGALTAASLLLPWAGRAALRQAISIGTLLDGIWLAWAFHVCGDLSGAVGYLVLVHIAGVTLLSSFRSGLKIAIWDSLLAVVVLALQADDLLGAHGHALPVGELGTYILLLTATTAAVATFAAVNERELRRRRYDSEVLRVLGLALEQAEDPAGIARTLCRFACEELLAGRALLAVGPDGAVAESDDPDGPQRWASAVLALVAPASDRPLPTTPGGPFDGRVRAAIDRRTTVLARFDEAPGGWLGTVLPDLRNAMIIPFHLDTGGEGVLVLDFSDLGAGRRTRLDRRAMTTAEQATAHVALALDRAALVDRLHREANRDDLTGLANRRALDAEMRAHIDSGRTFSIALFDLDHFKDLNDRYGHGVGDEALRDTANQLRRLARPGDVAARYGGEELLLIMPDLTAEAAAELADAVRVRIAETTRPQVTTSVGIATFPDHGSTEDDLIASADHALYRAKAAGRNRLAIGTRRGRQPTSSL